MRCLAILLGFFSLTALASQQALTFAPPRKVPPDKDEASLIAKRTGELKKAVERLRKLGVRDPNLADVEVYLKAARSIVRHDEFYKGGAKQTITVLDQGLLRAAQQGRGDSPWLTAPQGTTVVRAYRSRIDGSLQPYAVTYPHDYAQDRRKRYRLDVELHGRDPGLTEVKFLAAMNGKAAPKDLSFVQVDVYGRGNNAYRWAGEADVYEAVENFFAVESLAARSNFVDGTRVVLRGFSMGGAGTWHLGLHRPDQWCAIGPGAGFTTTHGYAGKDKVPDKLPDYQERCLKIYDAVEYAENAFNVPVVAYSGEEDPQKKAADLVEARLKKLDIPMTHLVAPKTEHTIPAAFQAKRLAELAKHADRERDDYPKKVRFVTYTLKYPSCNWVELMGLERHYDQARVEASKVEGGFSLKTKNVRVLRLALWPGATRAPLNVAIDGQELEAVRPHLSRTGDLFVYLEKGGGKWATVLPERIVVDRMRTPQKVTGLQGPIDDAFTAPFLCVRGTGKAWHGRTDEYARADLERFAREWAKYFRGELPVKDDSQVTAEDMATRHLILFGDPGSNSLIKEVLPRLPLRWSKKTIAFAGKEYDSGSHLPVLIHPSPLAADKYVVLNSGHTFHAAELAGTNALLFPRLGDHAVLKLAADQDSKDPLGCEVVSAGLFDEFWRADGGGKQ